LNVVFVGFVIYMISSISIDSLAKRSKQNVVWF